MRGCVLIRAVRHEALTSKRLEIILGRDTRGRLRILGLVHVWGIPLETL